MFIERRGELADETEGRRNVGRRKMADETG